MYAFLPAEATDPKLRGVPELFPSAKYLDKMFRAIRRNSGVGDNISKISSSPCVSNTNLVVLMFYLRIGAQAFFDKPENESLEYPSNIFTPLKRPCPLEYQSTTRFQIDVS